MTPFTRHTGLAAPLARHNVDTDQIIPKQFLKRIERTGFGQFLFFDWRFTEDGERKPDFVLNQPRYHGASVLVSGENFGCGSSREHAPWALYDYGFRVLIASSYADIFYNNCVQNGLLPVKLAPDQITQLLDFIDREPGLTLTIDLENQTIDAKENLFHAAFEMNPERRQSLLKGLDPIGETLLHEDAIQVFEREHPSPIIATA